MNYLPYSTKFDGTTVVHAADVNNLQANLTDISYDVMGYGATGNGSTDDTVAVQAAINAANSNGGGMVWFPKGTYLCTLLTHYSNVSLCGVGPMTSVIKLKNSQNTALLQSNGFVTTDTVGGVFGYFISGLGFDGNKTNQTSLANGLLNLYGYNFALRDVHVFHSFGAGIYSNWASSASSPGANGEGMEARLDRVEVWGCGGDGIDWSGPHDSVMTGVIVHENGLKGFNVMARGNATKFIACHAWGSGHTYPWYVAATDCALIECEGEGGSVEQAYIGANDCRVFGGHYFAASGATIGIEIACAGLILDTKVSNCTTEALLLTNDAGQNLFTLNVFGTGSNNAVSGTLSGNSRLIAAAVNGGMQGSVLSGARLLPGIWAQSGTVAASQTNAWINLYGGSTIGTPRMLRNGFISAMIVSVATNCTAGTLTAQIMKNGTATGQTAVISTSNPGFKTLYLSPTTIPYNVGDTIGVQITTTGTWAPTANTVSVEIEVTE